MNSRAAPTLTKSRILVVEAEMMVARDIACQLVALGYQVVGHVAARVNHHGHAFSTPSHVRVVSKAGGV